ncbi:unnamed protein product [Prorocentrum cordatum]|uniref:Phospholipase/carboxylesterase/thioesterase domain-containing protein n=1 Tax=Prorocentrum cordatum TaxID=2364126 RepID=A0ABN9Y901_9DINO|nr:unnamed protein product [Polarella glacialis]
MAAELQVGADVKVPGRGPGKLAADQGVVPVAEIEPLPPIGADTLVVGTSAATAVVIWMHGLGDSPEGWAHVARRVQRQLGHTRWLLPCAPKNPVSCNRGMVMTSWMDLLAIPISPTTPDNGLHLPESVAIVHQLVDSQLARGVPASRIVLGGFSQGGALSLVAALKYPQRLAGACVLSGWCHPSAGVPALLEASPSRPSRFLVCHGDADAVVRPGCGGAVREALAAAGSPVAFRSYPGMGHSSCEAELQDLECFLREVLPEEPGCPAPAA